MNRTVDLGNGKFIALLPGGDIAMFYSDSPAETRCIGHLRFDIDTCGKFWSSWWPHEAEQEYNREPFKSELNAIITALKRDVFRDPNRAFADLNIPTLDAERCYYGFRIDTENYSYYFRVYPYPGDYSYCYCYIREA